MSKSNAASVLSDKAQSEIERLQGLLKSGPTPREVWDHVLTPADKKRIRKPFEKCFRREHVVDVWARLREMSQIEATIDLAERLWLPNRITEWLRRETGLNKPVP